MRFPLLCALFAAASPALAGTAPRMAVLVHSSGAGTQLTTASIEGALRDTSELVESGSVRSFLAFERGNARDDESLHAAVIQLDLDRLVAVEAGALSKEEIALKASAFDRGGALHRKFLMTAPGAETAAVLAWVAGLEPPQAKSTAPKAPFSADPPDIVSIGITPKAIHRPAPRYPAKAREENRTDEVIIEITVNEEGRVIAAKILEGDDVFVAAALEAVRQWRYAPVLVNGQPIVWKSKVSLKFRLN